MMPERMLCDIAVSRLAGDTEFDLDFQGGPLQVRRSQTQVYVDLQGAHIGTLRRAMMFD